MSDEQRKRDLGAFFGSVHGTLNHLLWADRAWMLRFTGDEFRYRSRDAAGHVIEHAPYGRDLYADFSIQLDERKRTDRDISAWVQGLSDVELNANISYKNVAGQTFENPLWWSLSHLFNHQTHHRGQVTTLLKQLGYDSGVTDLGAFMREQPPS
jgi:uncharacterized damage-inducible protein DinB